MSRLLRAGTGGFTEIIIPQPADTALWREQLRAMTADQRIDAAVRYAKSRYAARVSPSPWEYVVRHAGGRWY